jgi:hypothetical protein
LVVDKDSNAGIPYVTIGLSLENTGVNADETGRFQLLSNGKFENDTLVISCVGYESKRIPISSLQDASIQIELKRSTNALHEVIVAAKTKPTYLRLNEPGSCTDCHEFQATEINWCQLSQLIRSPISNQIVSSVTFCTTGDRYPSEKALFRVRFYAVDSVLKSPSYDLCNRLIEVDATHRRNVTVDLDEYNIVIRDSAFFVGIEWLKTPQMMADKKLYVDGTTDLYYGPGFALREVKDPSSTAWMMDYKGKWHQLKDCLAKGRTMMSLVVSATVRY